METLETHELRALLKLISFVKFKSFEYDAKELAGSPTIMDLNRKAKEEISKRSGRVFEDQIIEDFPEYLDSIKAHLNHTDNWLDIGIENQIGLVKSFCSPFKVREETISQLIKYADGFHKNASGSR